MPCACCKSGRPYAARTEYADVIDIRQYYAAVVYDVGSIANTLGNHALDMGSSTVSRLASFHDDDCCPICRRLAPWGCLQCSSREDELIYEHDVQTSRDYLL